MKSDDAEVKVEIAGKVGSQLPHTSIFSNLDEASSFFEGGSVGYSVTGDPGRLDGLELQTNQWRVEPFDVSNVYSSYFSDEAKFPKGFG